MVEKNIHDYMQQKYSVIIDWGDPLETSGDYVRLLRTKKQDKREEHQIMKNTIKDEIGKISVPIRKKETSALKDNKPYQDILEKIIWRDQTHVIDSCVKYEIPPAQIASILVDRGYYKDVRSAEGRIKRHLVSDTQSKRLKRDILTQSEYHNYLRKFKFPMPKHPYS